MNKYIANLSTTTNQNLMNEDNLSSEQQSNPIIIEKAEKTAKPCKLFHKHQYRAYLDLTHSFNALDEPDSKDELNDEEIERIIEDALVLKRLTNNLLYLFHITEHEDYLTFLLGYGECSSNRDALLKWVSDSIKEHQLTFETAMSTLTEMLHNHMGEELQL